MPDQDPQARDQHQAGGNAWLRQCRLNLRLWTYRHLDRRTARMNLWLARQTCRIGWHRRMYGGTHSSGTDLVTLRWCPGRCGREWEVRVPMLTNAEVFERDVLRPLMSSEKSR